MNRRISGRVHPAVVFVGVVTALAALVVGCGGDDRLPPAAFCDEFTAASEASDGTAGGIAAALAELADRAPTPELGDAVAEVAEVFSVYASVEAEGGDAAAALAELAADPSVAESVTTFADFLGDECGIALEVPVDG